jgi:hypothetical protein
MRCVDCRGPIPDDENNALFLEMQGGYALFVESDQFMSQYFRDNNPLVLCHDCAHKLCDMLPWLNNIIEPQTSHTHRPGEDH